MVDDADLLWLSSPYGRSDSSVEIAIAGDRVYMRNSREPDGPWLAFTRAEFRAFLRGITESGITRTDG